VQALFGESCGLLQRTRLARTFTGREVFSPTYRPRPKMILFYFAAFAAAKLGETKKKADNIFSIG
jgi:hypothetical protein